MLFVLLLPARDGAAQGGPPAWTAATIDSMVELNVALAEAAGPDALGRLVVAASLHSVASAGLVRRLLGSFRSSSPVLDDQARWLGRSLEPPPVRRDGLAELLSPPRVAADPQGLVRAFALLGPFEDTGGGLDRAEGPESPGHRYDGADYSWGAYRVRYQPTVPGLASARGLDLDLYVVPRKETCTYLESVVRFPSLSGGVPPGAGGHALVLHVAGSGALRVTWDGEPALRAEEMHPDLRLDRVAAQVGAGPGEHLLGLKICTGAIMDAGRVRVRFTDLTYRPVVVESRSAIGELARVRAALATRSGADAGAGHRPVPIPTLLEAALGAADGADSKAWLVAALVRTLGAADDLQSPRASGLLDGVVVRSDVGLDELALAGWCSPSAANRSGWLERTVSAARAAGEGATALFAQRILVETRLLTGQPESARTTALAPPLGEANDDHAQLLRARALSVAGGQGFAASARRQLARLAAARQEQTPIAVWQALASLGEMGQPELRLHALAQLRATDPDPPGARWARALAPFHAGLAVDAALEELGRVRSSAEVMELGRSLQDLGRYDLGRQAYQAAAALSPNASAAAIGLARAELETERSPEASERALGALERARELDPQRSALGAEIDFRQADGGAPRPSQAADDLRYLVEPTVFLARAAAKPARVGAEFERVLHWRRVVRLHDDRRVSQLMHWAREIVVEPRTENERYEDLYVGASHVELLLARVHRRDGSIVGPEEQETPSGGIPVVRWPKLGRGDVVEIAVRGWTAGPVNRRGDVPFYFVDYVGSLDTRPVLYNEVIVDAPLGGPLAFDVLHGKPDRTEQRDQDGRRITRLIWDDPPTVHDEPLAPAASELLPVVVGSSYPTWESFTAWYQGAVADFTEPDEQVRRLAAELTSPKAGRPLSRAEKVERLFEFVADDIRYVNYVSGEWWLPNRPQQLLARRQGDCDDKAMLLISLLRAVGIDAVEALVQTRHTGQPSVLEQAKVAVPLFDHGIVYLPPAGAEPGQWLDATSPESRIGALPAMDLGAAVLLVGAGVAPAGGGPARPIRTPAGRAADHGVEARWTLRLDETGDGSIDARERHVGDSALLLRMNLRQPDARAPWVEQQLLAGWFSAVELDPEVDFEPDLPAGAAEVRFRGRSERVGRREADDLVVALGPRMPVTAELAPLPRRTLPVVLPPAIAPRRHLLEVRIEAPKTLMFAELPPDGVEDGGPFGRASVSFARSTERGAASGEVVVLRREIAIEQTRIEVPEYEAWRRWLQRIDRLVQRGVRLQPRPR